MLWYKTLFAIPADIRGKKLILHFGAIDWECRVEINGNYVDSHSGGYDPFSLCSG